MKKIWMIGVVVILFISSLSILSLASQTITKKTDFKYEAGLKITKDNQVIENQVFYDVPIGIAVWSSNNHIINCTFINCNDEGILLIGSNNTIESCVFYKCVDGIELQRSSNNTFINCRFTGNSHAGVDGILDSNNNNSFYNCVFYDNPYGCYFSKSIGTEFDDCLFLNNVIDVEEK